MIVLSRVAAFFTFPDTSLALKFLQLTRGELDQELLRPAPRRAGTVEGCRRQTGLEGFPLTLGFCRRSIEESVEVGRLSRELDSPALQDIHGQIEFGRDERFLQESLIFQVCRQEREPPLSHLLGKAHGTSAKELLVANERGAVLAPTPGRVDRRPRDLGF